jgi:hypothetical protein
VGAGARLAGLDRVARSPGLLDATLNRLDTFDDDWWEDQFLADFLGVASRIGPSALPALGEYIRDPQKWRKIVR